MNMLERCVVFTTFCSSSEARGIIIERRHKKTCFCICENKGADQLRGNHAADQCSCAVTVQLISAFVFCDIQSTIPLLSESESSSLYPSSVVVQPGLCRTRSETPKTGFFGTQLILEN